MSYIYEEKEIKKGRTTKWCSHCGEDIPKGTPHTVLTAHEDEFFSLVACSDKCKAELYKEWDTDD